MVVQEHSPKRQPASYHDGLSLPESPRPLSRPRRVGPVRTASMPLHSVIGTSAQGATEISPASMPVQGLQDYLKGKSSDMVVHIRPSPLCDEESQTLADPSMQPHQLPRKTVKFLVDDADRPVVDIIESNFVFTEQSQYEDLWFMLLSKREACQDASKIQQLAGCLESEDTKIPGVGQPQPQQPQQQRQDYVDTKETRSKANLEEEATFYLNTMSSALRELALQSATKQPEDAKPSAIRLPPWIPDPCSAPGLEHLLFPKLAQDRRQMRRIFLQAQAKLPPKATELQKAGLLATVSSRLSRPSRRFAHLLGVSDAANLIHMEEEEQRR